MRRSGVAAGGGAAAAAVFRALASPLSRNCQCSNRRTRLSESREGECALASPLRRARRARAPLFAAASTDTLAHIGRLAGLPGSQLLMYGPKKL